MVKEYSPAVLALAEENGIPAGDLPIIINGCSGGFSKFYRLAFSRMPSCESCCDLHDLHYQLGGSRAARKAADVELRKCAMQAGLFPAGISGKARRVWRWLRAWIMYGAVRAFGRRYWG